MHTSKPASPSSGSSTGQTFSDLAGRRACVVVGIEKLEVEDLEM
ncbi:hypothetical protein [Lysobacter sp. CA199]